MANTNNQTTKDETTMNPYDCTELPVRATTERTPELYEAIKRSPGKCVIHNGYLRVLFNTEYRRDQAVNFGGDE